MTTNLINKLAPMHHKRCSGTDDRPDASVDPSYDTQCTRCTLIAIEAGSGEWPYVIDLPRGYDDFEVYVSFSAKKSIALQKQEAEKAVKAAQARLAALEKIAAAL